MRVFVYEWTCSVADAPPSLEREGCAMLRAVLDDLLGLPDVQPVALLHESCTHQLACETHRVNTKQHLERFGDLVGGADGTLIIAPETNQVLLQLARHVEKLGGQLLGPSSEAIALTSDKDRLGQCWKHHGVRTPAVAIWKGDARSLRFPAVLKPREGAGATATFLLRCPDDLRPCLEQARAEGHQDDFVVQDLVAGQSASVAFLVGPAGLIALVPAAQRLSGDGRFRYEGGSLPLPAPLAQRAVALGRRAVDVVQGLRGYVGVDLVLGDAADGSQDFAIEINPRLTTSYIGLRMLAETNLAGAVLGMLRGDIPELRWRKLSVTFGPDGSVEARSV